MAKQITVIAISAMIYGITSTPLFNGNGPEKHDMESLSIIPIWIGAMPIKSNPRLVITNTMEIIMMAVTTTSENFLDKTWRQNL
jgi:hypothetical protein